MNTIDITSKILALVQCILLIVGCTQLPASQITSKIDFLEKTPAKFSKKNEIFITSGDLIQLNKGTYGFLWLADEIATKLRINYSIFCDLSGYKADFIENIDFKNEDSLLKITADNINNKYSKKINYEITGDGFDLCTNNNKTESKEFRPYKKFYLSNITEREAGYYISRLLGAPYTEFRPSGSQKLSLPEDYARKDQSNNAATNSIPSGDWRMFQHIDSSGGQDTETTNKVRWISIPQQNALVISADSQVLQQATALINAIDKKSPQILIEAKAFSYSAATAKVIGSAFNLKGPNNSSITVPLDSGVLEGLSRISISQNFINDKYQLLLNLAANESIDKIRILAEPRLLIKPGQESIIDISTTKLVQTIPPSSASASASGSNTIVPFVTTAKDISTGLYFAVRATVLGDGKIQLDLRLRQSEFSPSNEANVVISTSENQIVTSLICNEGEVISFGGIIRKKSQAIRSGMIGLRDLPVIGNLFGYDERDSTDEVVEFFIIPTIAR